MPAVAIQDRLGCKNGSAPIFCGRTASQSIGSELALLAPPSDATISAGWRSRDDAEFLVKLNSISEALNVIHEGLLAAEN